jgi:hypothetical protein
LAAAATATGSKFAIAETVSEALDLASTQQNASQQQSGPLHSGPLHPGLIVVSGSVYLVGEARTLLLDTTAPNTAPNTAAQLSGRPNP